MSANKKHTNDPERDRPSRDDEEDCEDAGFNSKQYDRNNDKKKRDGRPG